MTHDARPRPARRRGRALSALAVTSGFGALGFGILAFAGGGAGPEAPQDVSTFAVDPAPTTTASETNETTTTLATAPPAATPDSSPTSSPVPARKTLPVLPRERGSAIPIGRVAPRSITIGDVELWAPVRPVAIEPNGELEVPDESEVGWYSLGAAPGEPGATVLAAHVTWDGAVGPFYRLADLEPGAEISVARDDGTSRIYQVVERAMYPKDALPAERIWRTTGDETLVLITCGGSFNPEIRRYRDNIVVYAVPVD